MRHTFLIKNQLTLQNDFARLQNDDIYESVDEKSKHKHLKFATFLDTPKFEVILKHYKNL